MTLIGSPNKPNKTDRFTKMAKKLKLRKSHEKINFFGRRGLRKKIHPPIFSFSTISKTKNDSWPIGRNRKLCSEFSDINPQTVVDFQSREQNVQPRYRITTERLLNIKRATRVKTTWVSLITQFVIISKILGLRFMNWMNPCPEIYIIK